MKRWGIVITAFYAAFVVLLLLPAGGVLIDGTNASDFLQAYRRSLDFHKWAWPVWLYVGMLVAGQALLLFLSVDTSWRHAKPRQHIALTAAFASFFMALLVGSAVYSLDATLAGKNASYLAGGSDERVISILLAIWVGLWIFWGAVFYRYYRGSPDIVSTMVAWLLKGSVLELLVSVVCHVIVRQRGDCSAPAVTGFGIVTGIAIMLLSFGPGVLALYKKRLDAYSRPPGDTSQGK